MGKVQGTTYLGDDSSDSQEVVNECKISCLKRSLFQEVDIDKDGDLFTTVTSPRRTKVSNGTVYTDRFDGPLQKNQMCVFTTLGKVKN